MSTPEKWLYPRGAGGGHQCITVSECDISTDLEMWEWNYFHVGSTLSCLAYIIPIPEINLIPTKAQTQWLDMS